MMAVMQGLAGQAGAPLSGGFERFRRETTITVEIEPATARPHHARYEQVIDLDDARQLEVRDTTFDWARATGCVAPS